MKTSEHIKYERSKFLPRSEKKCPILVVEKSTQPSSHDSVHDSYDKCGSLLSYEDSFGPTHQPEHV